jgi:acetolactate synthase-1/2/3 large subunit
MHLNDSLGRHTKLKFVCNLHEQGCAIAAEAYGQYAGLGVALVTTGPGGTNTITGLAGAWLESTPMLVISGQVKRADLTGGRGVRQIGFQEIDIVTIVKPITKFAKTVIDPSLIKCVLEEAVWTATHGRKGPVWIDIPLDVQAAEIDPSKLKGFVPRLPETIDASVLTVAAQKTLELLAGSKRPVALVGNGVRHSGAIDAFIFWAEKIGIPVMTTWKSLDFIQESHPLYVGRPGAVGQRAANFAQQKCDLLICIGARLDYGQTAYNHPHFAPNAKRVVVDIDENELAKLEMDLAVSLAADAGDFLRELIANANEVVFPNWEGWLSKCWSWKRRFPIVLPSYRSVSSGVLVNNELVVPGSSGACSEVTCQALPVSSAIRVLNTQGLGAMGFGIPAALGACLAGDGRRTICIDGDGGFPMNAQELALIAHLNLPIVFFVLNNLGYGSIRTTQVNYFNRRFMACDEASGLHLQDLAMLAGSAGIPYSKIESQIGLRESIATILRVQGPVICDVSMTPDQFTQPKVSSKQNSDGRMVTMPMEDLWPFLDRREFDAIMSE